MKRLHKLLCLLGIHTWRYPNPFARICTNNHCNRLDEIHADISSGDTWNLFSSKGNYWLTTRKSIIKSNEAPK